MAEMIQLSETERNSNSVVTVGTFDGVHAGHRVLIRKVVESARRRGAKSVIVTFDPHPREIINPGEAGISLLTTLSERCELLADIGIDQMIVIPFDRDFSLLDSESFLRRIIWQKVGLSEFVIGYDHHFGRNREGTIGTVQAVAGELGFDVHVVSRQEVGEKTVSSTVIRKTLQKEGDVVLAARLLEREYRLNGTVVHGEKRGKAIGYPTANIRPEDRRKVIPRNGVYAVKVRIDRDYFDGMMNIGIRPTFEGQERTLEVHLFDFHKDLYGETIQVRFVERIRDEKTFAGIDELKRQLDMDKDSSRTLLSKKE